MTKRIRKLSKVIRFRPHPEMDKRLRQEAFKQNTTITRLVEAALRSKFALK